MALRALKKQLQRCRIAERIICFILSSVVEKILQPRNQSVRVLKKNFPPHSSRPCGNARCIAVSTASKGAGIRHTQADGIDEGCGDCMRKVADARNAFVMFLRGIPQDGIPRSPKVATVLVDAGKEFVVGVTMQTPFRRDCPRSIESALFRARHGMRANEPSSRIVSSRRTTPL
jgi:hypothetical protein